MYMCRTEISLLIGLHLCSMILYLFLIYQELISSSSNIFILPSPTVSHQLPCAHSQILGSFSSFLFLGTHKSPGFLDLIQLAAWALRMIFEMLRLYLW